MARKSAAKKAVRKNVRKNVGKSAKKAARKPAKRASSRAAQKTSTKRAVKATRPVKRARPAAGRGRDVVVLVGDAAIHEVAARLRSKGMKVDSVLEATGMITGTYAKEPSALSGVKGVTGVEETAPIQLPPPESDTQ